MYTYSDIKKPKLHGVAEESVYVFSLEINNPPTLYNYGS